MNTIIICLHLHVFWLRKVLSIKYARNWWWMVGAAGGGRAHPKCVHLRTWGGHVTPHLYMRTCTISFNVFGSIFVFLSFFCLKLTFIQKRCVRQNISSKNLKWKHHLYTNASWNYLLLNMAVWWGCISMRGRDRGGEGRALISNLFLISHRWYDVKKLAVPGSRKLNSSFSRTQQNVLC